MSRLWPYLAPTLTLSLGIGLGWLLRGDEAGEGGELPIDRPVIVSQEFVVREIESATGLDMRSNAPFRLGKFDLSQIAVEWFLNAPSATVDLGGWTIGVSTVADFEKRASGRVELGRARMLVFASDEPSETRVVCVWALRRGR